MAEVERRDDLGGAVRGEQGDRNENLEGAVGGIRHPNLQGRLMSQSKINLRKCNHCAILIIVNVI